MVQRHQQRCSALRVNAGILVSDLQRVLYACAIGKRSRTNLQANRCFGELHSGCSSLCTSLDLLEVAVLTARSEHDFYVCLTPVAPVPAMLARERGHQIAFISGHTASLFVADGAATAIAVSVVVDGASIDDPLEFRLFTWRIQK